MSSSRHTQPKSISHPEYGELVQVGQLKKPYGIKGWLWVYSETDERDAIFSMQPWWIKTAIGMKPLTLLDWRPQASGLVAQFKEVADRTMAETMNGVTIWVSKQSLPPLQEDEYYWSDLVGLTVNNTAGQCFGKIKELFETGAHAIMVVAPTSESVDEQERLIPWHKQTIESVDVPNGVVVVEWQDDY